MFTGIIQQRGRLERITRRGPSATLEIGCKFEALVHGESIAIDGTCLSVTGETARGFTCDASAETLRLTTLGELSPGTEVNLERALKQGDALGGHVVSGHVDGVGRVVAHEPLGDALKVVFEVPEVLAPFLAPKGSVAIDGISLTVNHAQGLRFDVVLIPVTREETRLDTKAPGARVNLEVDVLAKYVARLLGRPGVDGAPADNPGEGLRLETLRDAGYL